MLVLALIVLAQVGTGAARAAEGSLDASGFDAGPIITHAGLVWEGSAGVLLTRADGTTSVLAGRGVPNWDNLIDRAWFGSRWWAIARAGGVFGGRVGGTLGPLRALARCNPGSTVVPVGRTGGSPLLAISGADLLVALPRSCAARSHVPATLVRIDLSTGGSRVLATLHAMPESIVAAGRYVALVFTRNTSPGATREAEPHGVVRVLDARTGALVRQVTPPVQDEGSAAIQLDASGDVLGACCKGPAGDLAQTAQLLRIERYWWSPATSKAAKQIQLGEYAVLSDRRIAYVGFSADRSAIDVRDMHTGQTRTAVTFVGSARPGSLSMSDEALAWEQQSFGLLTPPGACLSVELSPPQLMSLNLRTPTDSPLLVTGPEAPALQHECISVAPPSAG